MPFSCLFWTALACSNDNHVPGVPSPRVHCFRPQQRTNLRGASATMIIHSMRRGPATHIGHMHMIGGRFIETCDRPASAERKINHNVQWKLCGSRSRSVKNFGPIEIEVH